MRFAARSVGSVAALVLVTLVAASPAGAAPPVRRAFWGPPSVDGVSQFPIYHDLGVNIFQIAIGWQTTAPTRPRRPSDPTDRAYHWPRHIDYAIEQARRYGMDVLIMLVGAPRWANGHTAWQYAPRRARDFARSARAAPRRYPFVRYWMIWGEPTRVGTFRPI